MRLLALLCLVAVPVFANAPFRIGIPGFPKALVQYAAYDELAQAIDTYLYEPLLRRDARTLRPVGVLAASWTESRDHLRYTFRLRPEAHFSDGRPVTADDIVFTWNWIHEPATPMIPYVELFRSFSGCRAEGPRTVVFTARAPHFKNLDKLTELFVLPRHAPPDKTKPYAAALVGSGPYTLREVEIDHHITLQRDPNWWGRSLDVNRGLHRLDTLVFRAVRDPQMLFEMFARGEIDYHYFLVSRIWATQTDGAAFRDGRLKKLVAKSSLPFGTSAIAWNLRRPLFSDRRVRRALAMLFDRRRLLRELFYDAYVPSTGVVKSTSEFHSPDNQPIEFDPAGAAKLLREAGWAPGEDGILHQGGRAFAFEILTKETAAERFLTRYQETLRAAGIALSIRVGDWASTLKRIDARDFDAVLTYRGREVEPSDFAADWGTRAADIPGSANLTGLRNRELDRLADKLDRTFDRAARRAITRRIDALIAREQPMLFTWEQSAWRIGYRAGFTFDGEGFRPYDAWYEIFQTWRAADLATAGS